MIIVRLRGRLGNQLFQYAMARALALDRDAEMAFDLSHFYLKPYGCGLRGFNFIGRKAGLLEIGPMILLSNLSTVAQLHLPKSFRSLAVWLGSKALSLDSRLRPGMHRLVERRDLIGFERETLEKAMSLPEDIYLDGFWQSERYFLRHAQVIRKELTPRLPLSEGAKTIEMEMAKCDAVSLHVRRGDYVNLPGVQKVFGACSLEYYSKAVDIMSQRYSQPHLFVFSDDIEWAKDHLRFDLPMSFVSGTAGVNDLEELVLMTKCKGNIIANSTFSWWGAWLNSSPDKVVVAPSRWVVGGGMTAKEVVPDGWIKVSS
ncbi:MAG: alpha-1,2-fucosyltransferase [Methanomassiliicoccales archaeon]